jgi:hypothetical protein
MTTIAVLGNITAVLVRTLSGSQPQTSLRSIARTPFPGGRIG